MSARRVFISGVILTVLGWAVWVAVSLTRIGDSLPDLPSFDRQSVQVPAEAEPATAAPAEDLDPQRESAFSAEFEADSPAALDVTNSGAPVIPKGVRDLGGYRFLGVNPPLEARCALVADGAFIAETQVHPDVLRSLSDEELQALVDSRDADGMLQRAYARNLRAAASEGSQYSVLPSLSDDETIRKYDIRAVRGRNQHSAADLAGMYYEVDRVESNAWWRILLEMGYDARGGLAIWVPLRGRPPYTDQESRNGADRADELINELALLPGLGVPEECLTPDKLAEQRAHLAVLVHRLARRVMPSSAPGEPPEPFNRLNGHALVVEDVCSFSCPTDVQRVIYYQDVPGSDACALIDGVEQMIEARTPSGRYEERTFCVPGFLAQN